MVRLQSGEDDEQNRSRHNNRGRGILVLFVATGGYANYIQSGLVCEHDNECVKQYEFVPWHIRLFNEYALDFIFHPRMHRNCLGRDYPAYAIALTPGKALADYSHDDYKQEEGQRKRRGVQQILKYSSVAAEERIIPLN